MTEKTDYDVIVVGAGLVGLSVARALQETRPDLSILVVDKESSIAAHQSSHNSGVVHSGLYYQPGSLKAQLSSEGRQALFDLCDEAGIPYRRSGKLVVATKESQLPALADLERRGRANGLTVERHDLAGMRQREPEVSGVAGLFVPESGVVDFRLVADHLAVALAESEVEVRTGFEVTAIVQEGARVIVHSDGGEVSARVLVNCAGLHSDRVAALAGLEPRVKIIPFRGEYYGLGEEAQHLVKGLVYPVPDPRFPFLGVHFTRSASGAVEVGPNALLALGRENYGNGDRNWRDVRETLAYPGFLRLATRHWSSGAKELFSSKSKHLYARLAQKLIPAIRQHHLVDGGTGVRAQAVDRQGNLVDDFVIERSGSMIHVLNAPSPGATASLAIGRHVATQVIMGLDSPGKPVSRG